MLYRLTISAAVIPVKLALAAEPGQRSTSHCLDDFDGDGAGNWAEILAGDDPLIAE